MRWLMALFTILCLIALSTLLVTKPTLLQKISFSQAVYDEEHHLLRMTLSQDEKYRLFTPLSQISPLLIETTLLEEDQYFFWHFGINPVAILKAAWQTYLLKTRPIGASTITMQVARICYGIPSKRPLGKIWQIIKAMQLELFYSKEEILEAYLNLASYGGNIEGVGAASQIYFSKPASQLHLIDALELSVIPQHPNRRMPIAANAAALKCARDRLFQRWIIQHPEDREKETLIELPLQLTKKRFPFHAPHFVERILKQNSQLEVVTTLNLKLQKIIEKVTEHYLEEQKWQRINNTAVMLVDTRRMEVKALIGSGNYYDREINGQVNGSIAKRSPGSTLKPFIYALALDQGLIHPYTVLKDAATQFGDYNPENFDHDFLGPIKAKDALTLSRNIPAISLAEQLSNPTFYQFLQQLPISKLKPESAYGLSLVLGGAEATMEELVALYAMLLNHGVWKPLRTTTQQPLCCGKRLLSSEASFLTLDMLKETQRPYLSHPMANNSLPVSWKTGTSSGYRDAWAIGVFGPYVLAVWIGDFNSKSNPAYVGITAAAPLFFNLIEAISKEEKDLIDLVKPTTEMNLTRVEVCEASGLLPNPHCPHCVTTWFIPGKSPIKVDDVHQKIAINRQSGLHTDPWDPHAEFVIYECWPSDLLKIFAQAGVQRKSPPPFKPGKEPVEPLDGNPPKILSPQPHLTYTERYDTSDNFIVFMVAGDSDTEAFYWFVDHQCIGKVKRDQSLFWPAKAGNYMVRVVDNFGRSSSCQINVEGFR